nr:MAG TPA: hypothetical protein [Caudoviricetes sp.]
MFIVVYYALKFLINKYKKFLKKRGDCGENIFIQVFR